MAGKTPVFLILSALAVLMVSSCAFFGGIVNDGDPVVAKVGKNRLYLSELSSYIPEGVSAADSTNLALAYINTWATGAIFNDEALAQLSKEERDVTRELEEYRQSLLRFRYEQRYISDRLDTLVSEEQKREFFGSHKDLFVLERPILKVRFVEINKGARFKDEILAKMASKREEDLIAADSLAFLSAIRYFDSSDTWIDAARLAKEFGTDYGTLLSCLSGNYIVYGEDDKSILKIAYVQDIMRSGVAPFEFCESRIRDYILNARKKDLLVALEKQLLQDATESGALQIF